MASYYHYNAHQGALPPASLPAAAHHNSVRARGGAPRLRQNAHHKQHQHYRHARKEEEAVALLNFRARFELQRSFDLDDDLEFCPTLVTDADMGASVDSSTSSDRSSTGTGSPDASPQSHSVAPEPTFLLGAAAAPYVPPSYHRVQTTPLKLHQPAATRVRSAIPIVNPSTGLSMSSPPQSVSPSRMQSSGAQRW